MSNSYNLTQKDSSNYEDGYKIFLQRSDFRERILEKFSSIAKCIIGPNDHFKIMDLGCGDGQMTLRYLKSIKSAKTNFELNLVEPALSSLASAQLLLKDEVDFIKTFSEIPETGSFNLIIASYVFYHLPPETLNILIKLIAPKGSMCIMMGTSGHPLKSHPKLQSITNHGSSDKLTPFLKSLEDTKEFSISRNRVRTSTVLQGLWENGAFTDEGKTYLNFSLNKNFSNLPEMALDGLNEIFSEAFRLPTPELSSVHEIIWIERKR